MSANGMHHDWLSLIEISGPFLAVPVLKEVFPQGLEELDGAKRKRLRQAYEEWRDALESDDPQFPELHAAWVDEVLSRVLELDEDGRASVLKRTDWCIANLRVSLPEHAVTLAPDLAVVDEQRANKPLMLIHTYAQDTDLDATRKMDDWAATPAERMVQLCRATGCRLALVTNGERWMLIDAPVGAVTTFASWYARIWAQEPITLQAFVHLLGIRRFFVDEAEQLPALFDRSLKYQDEVTEALGEQVRRAVEVLIQALDKADQDRDRDLLRDVKEPELYEAALTLMMRLVFLLAAEERGLLLLGDERYEANYAISTLRMQLRTESEEILERRWDAWSRLLATFRAVFGGIEHENLRLPALGGSLFDPDRFPFLEGRAKGSSWRTEHARPLPIDNRTVLLLLEAIQQFQGRTLSYRALDVEQVGYVYEGLLERTVKRTAEVTLELDGTKNAKAPWIKLAELESAGLEGAARLAELLQDRSGSSPGRTRNDLAKPVDDTLADRLLATCHGDTGLRDRIKRYVHLVRTDPWGYPLIYPAGAFIVTTGSDRRETGTHYTPKSLTETIVVETLTPVVYTGPSEGMPRDQWKLKLPSEILNLKICDPAMGSGAFLVQACRWLAERLVEAWSLAEKSGGVVSVDGEVLDAATGKELLPRDAEARTLIARRLIAERCLYGVDLNPLAVELAKLSIWLVTLAKNRPFGFLDHNLRCGDSLLGIHRIDQLTELSLVPGAKGQQRLFGERIKEAVAEAIELRQRLRAIPIRDIRDVEAMARLDSKARGLLEVPERIADAFIGEVFLSGSSVAALDRVISAFAATADRAADGDRQALAEITRYAASAFATGLPARTAPRKPFHWTLEFPEVFKGSAPGFDCIIGNPPFLNAISNGTARADLDKKYYARAFPIFAQGSYDLSILFWARVLSHILCKTGRYGLVSPTSMLSTKSVWKEWMHNSWRPDSLTLFPIDFFHSAKIRTSAIVGGAGKAKSVRVRNLSADSGERAETAIEWDESETNWFSQITSEKRTDGVSITGIKLGEVAELSAGCTTGDAYNLKPLILDDENGSGRKLVTTGSIDRFAIKWGKQKTRYLKDDYQYPRWPESAIDRGVARAYGRQAFPKILVAGYTAVMEVWLDVNAEAAGIVQTWVLKRTDLGHDDQVVWLAALAGVLNGATFSREFVRRYGASSMTGNYIVVKKTSLHEMPVPQVFSKPASIVAVSTHDIFSVGVHEWARAASHPQVASLLARVSLTLGRLDANDLNWPSFDKLGHFLAAALFGRTEQESMDDYSWWANRCGVAQCTDDLSDILAMLRNLIDGNGE